MCAGEWVWYGPFLNLKTENVWKSGTKFLQKKFLKTESYETRAYENWGLTL